MSGANDNRADDTFGLCPLCQRHDGYLNIGNDHWFICRWHRQKWNYGSNIFSDWRDQSETEWEQNRRKLEWYREVQPFFWPETLAAHATALAAIDSPGNPFDGDAA